MKSDGKDVIIHCKLWLSCNCGKRQYVRCLLGATIMEQREKKVSDVLTAEYADFLSYCDVSGKVFVSDLTESDFLVFCARYNKPLEYGNSIKALIDDVLESLHSQDDESNETSVELSSSSETRNCLADSFGVDAALYADINVDRLELGVRSSNCLRNANIKTLEELLNRTEEELYAIRSMGARSVNEIKQCIEHFLREYHETDDSQAPDGLDYSNTKSLENISFTPNFKEAIESLLMGDQIDPEGLTNAQLACIPVLTNATEEMGAEICLEAYINPEYVSVVCDSLQEYAENTLPFYESLDKVKLQIRCLSSVIREKKVIPFIRAYTVKESGDFSEVIEVCDDEATINDIPAILEELRASEHIDMLMKHIGNFLKWMDFDFREVISNASKSILEFVNNRNKRNSDVMNFRAAGETLEAVASRFGLTRERIRQLEIRAYKSFSYAYSRQKYDLIMLTYAWRNGDSVIKFDELKQVVGEELATLLWVFVKDHLNNRNYYYSKTADAIVIRVEDDNNYEEEQLAEKTTEIIRKLPDVLEATQVKQMLSDIAEKHSIPLEIIEKVFFDSYRRVGQFYSQGRLTVVNMCDYVLKRYFPNGYKTNVAEEAENFRKHLVEHYGKQGGNMTYRAIDAKVGEIGVLCDRGRYIHPDYLDVAPEIMEAINAYIEASPRAEIMYAEIFDALQKKLAGTPITNRYLLQGALKKYGCKYSTTRDFVRRRAREAAPSEVDILLAGDEFAPLREELARHEILTIEALKDLKLWPFMNRYDLYSIGQRQKIFTKVNALLNPETKLDSSRVYVLSVGKDRYKGVTPAEAFLQFCNDMLGRYPLKFRSLIGVRNTYSDGIPVTANGNATQFMRVGNMAAYIRNDLTSDMVLNYTEWIRQKCGEPHAVVMVSEPAGTKPTGESDTKPTHPPVKPPVSPTPTKGSSPLIAGIEKFVLKADMQGTTYDEIKDALYLSAPQARQYVSESMHIVLIKNRLYHDEAFVDWEEGADKLEEIIEKLIQRNDGYISYNQLYEFARADMNMFLNDNDMNDAVSVYDMAKHLFEKVRYHGKQFLFAAGSHISRPDNAVANTFDIIRKFASDQGGVFRYDEIVEYINGLGLSSTNLRAQMRGSADPIYFNYDEGSYMSSTEMHIDAEWKSAMKKALQELLDNTGDHMILRAVPSLWFERLPQLPGMHPWTPLLLQSVLLKFGDELGARTIPAYSGGQSYDTLHAMLVSNESSIQTFGDVVIAFLIDSETDKRSFEAEELRKLLLHGKVLQGGEMYGKLPKAFEGDGRFAWDAAGEHVTVEV